MKETLLFFLLMLLSLSIEANSFEVQREPFLEIKNTNPVAYENIVDYAKKYPDSLIFLGQKEYLIEMKSFFIARITINRDSLKYDSSLGDLLLIKETKIGEKMSLILLLLTLTFLSMSLGDALYTDSRKWASIMISAAVLTNFIALFVSIFLISTPLIIFFGLNTLVAGRLLFYLAPYLPIKKHRYLFVAYYLLMVASLVVLI